MRKKTSRDDCINTTCQQYAVRVILKYAELGSATLKCSGATATVKCSAATMAKIIGNL